MSNTCLVSVAPGVYIDPVQRKDLNPQQKYVLLDAAGLKSLGLSVTQDKTLRRLDAAGLIKIHPITPRRRLLDMASWNKFLATLDSNPEYWEIPENKRLWRLACLSL